LICCQDPRLMIIQPKVKASPRARSHHSWLGQWRRHTNYLFVAPMLIYMTLMMAYPVLSNVYNSLFDLDVRTFRTGTAPFIGLSNYVDLLRDPAFLHAAGLSLIFTTTSLTFQFTIGFALALFFKHPFPGNGLLRSLLLLAWLLP